MKTHTVKYSIVVPVYNSERSLVELCERVINVFTQTIRESFEIILVDDASSDDSWAVLKKLSLDDVRIRVFRLMRNFGQHNATMCGFRKCRGEFAITLDDDLQTPPEEITKLVEPLELGYDVIVGVPAEKQHHFFRNVGSKAINLLLVKIFGKPKHLRFASPKVLRRNVVDRITRIRSSYCYLAGYILRNVSPRKIANVTVNHETRRYGRSNYSVRKIIGLASNLIVNFSAVPLRLGIYFGFAISAVCILYSGYILFHTIFFAPIRIQGWATLAVLISFLFGVLFLFLGTIGEYIYRILREVSAEEQYVVDESFDYGGVLSSKCDESVAELPSGARPQPDVLRLAEATGQGSDQLHGQTASIGA